MVSKPHYNRLFLQIGYFCKILKFKLDRTLQNFAHAFELQKFNRQINVFCSRILHNHLGKCPRPSQKRKWKVGGGKKWHQ